MRLCRKACRTSSSQWRRYATREFRRAISVVITIVKKLKRVSKSRRVDETKSPRLHLLKESCMNGTIPDVRRILHTRANYTPIQSKQLGWRGVILKALQNTQPLRSFPR